MSLKVPSMYQVLALDRSWSWLSVAKMMWRFPVSSTLMSSMMKSSGVWSVLRSKSKLAGCFGLVFSRLLLVMRSRLELEGRAPLGARGLRCSAWAFSTMADAASKGLSLHFSWMAALINVAVCTPVVGGWLCG